MKKYLYIFTISVAILFGAIQSDSIYAQSEILSGREKFVPDSDFIEKLQSNKSIKHISCKFKEIKHLSFLAEDALSYGNFTYNNGDISLKYTAPAGNMIQICNGEFTIINNGKKQSVNMNANPLMRQMGGMLSASMSGDIGMFGKESDIEYFKSAEEYLVLIKPSDKRTNKYLNKIILVFDKPTMTLNSLYMFENEVDYTRYVFTDKKITR